MLQRFFRINKCRDWYQAIMTCNFLSPPNQFKPREFKEFSATHLFASITMMSDRAKVPDWFGQIVIGQKFSDVFLYKLQCTLGRWTFSVTLDMVLNLPLNLQKSTSSVLEFSAVETTPLFDVFFREYIAEVEDKAHWWTLLGLLKCNHPDEIYERVDKVEDSRRTRILTKLTTVV